MSRQCNRVAEGSTEDGQAAQAREGESRRAHDAILESGARINNDFMVGIAAVAA